MIEVTIYTSAGAVTYMVRATTNNYRKDLTAALEQGVTTVDTVEGGTLIINPINAAAIEIRELDEDTPPGA